MIDTRNSTRSLFRHCCVCCVNKHCLQKETQQGAKNRAESAFQAYKEEKKTYPHMAIGLEGGLEWSSIVPDVTGQDSLWCMAWIAIYGKRNALLVDWLASLETKFYNDDKKPIFGLAKTGTFRLPSALAALVEQGMELGDAHDKVFGTVNSKQGSGTVGLLTNGVIDRAAYYEHAFLLALVPWVRPDVYLREGESGLAASFSCFSGKR